MYTAPALVFHESVGHRAAASTRVDVMPALDPKPGADPKTRGAPVAVDDADPTPVPLRCARRAGRARRRSAALGAGVLLVAAALLVGCG
jgi:hypothetical protein